MTPSELVFMVLGAFSPFGVLSVVVAVLFGLLVVLYRCAGSARAGSVLASATRARAWPLTLFLGGWIVALGAAPVGPRHGIPTTALVAAATASLALAAVALLDLRRFVSVVRVTTGLSRVDVDRATAPLRDPLDLGVGDDLWVSAASALAPYRGAVIVSAVRGSASSALRRLARVLVVDLALVVAWVAFVAAVLVPPLRPHGDYDPTTISARALRSAAEAWRAEHPGGGCPTPERLRTDGAIDAASKLTDAWDHPYVLSCAEDETWVHSWGPDGVDDGGYGDDIRIPARRSWTR